MTLVVALAMTTLGFVGLHKSIVALGSDAQALMQPHPSLPAAARETHEALMRTLSASPLRRALPIANLLASALLAIGSFAMTARVRSAPWWATQALWANTIYTLAAGAMDVSFALANRSALIEILLAIHEAQAAAEANALEGDPTAVLSVVFVLALGAVGVVYVGLAGIYVLLLRAINREDVRRFVTRETEAG